MRPTYVTMAHNTPDYYGDKYAADPDDMQVHSTDAELCRDTGSSSSGSGHGDRKSSLKCRPTKDKICLVCGDKALGYNFNAISCESCKAFFRRNAFKEIRGRCEGKCDVTVESRSYCKKCRLQKCISVGMKRDLILNDQQRQQRRQKIHENRLRRQGLPVPTPADYGINDGASSSRSPSSDHSSPGPDRVGSYPIKQEGLGGSGTMSHQFASSVDPNSLEGLSTETREVLEEVMHAFQHSFDGPMDYQPRSSPTSTEFLNMADTSVRRLVKMAKQLAVFRQLDQEDQIALLKGSVVEVLILRSAKMFDSNSMQWSVNKGGSQHQVSAQSFQTGNTDSISFFEQYRRFACSLIQVTQRDNIILMLMIVLTVLSPDRVVFKNTSKVSQAQELFAEVLREYIGVRYPKDEPMLARILQKLADIRDLNETHTRMLMHMKVEELEPLIVEIFDISS